MVAIPLGVMLVPIAEDLGWSRTTVAGAFTALSLSQAVAYPVAGRIADRFGTRRTLLTGFLTLSLALLLVSVSPASPIAFYALFAFTGFAGVLASTMVLAKLLAQWFDQRLGFWLGLVGGVGNGLGGMVMPGLAALMAATLGWRYSFAAIGLTILVVGLPLFYATLRAPEQEAAADDPASARIAGRSFAEVMRSPLYWVIFIAVALGGGALTGVFANTVTILETQGIATGAATLAVSLFAMVCVINEPLVGHLLDRASRPRRVAAFYIAAIAGLLLLAHAHTPAMAIAGAMLTGMGLGAEFSVLPYLLTRYFGLREMGAISGVAYAGALIGNGLSPLLLNGLFEYTGSYALGLYLVAALVAFAFAVFLVLPAFVEDLAE
nr:MFS transporter [Novosphingobium sp. Rr 2-17]